jgi:hypothetical protein
MSTPIQEFLRPFKIPTTNIYAIPSDVFKKLDIRTWKYNRPPDEIRVSEIKQWSTQFKRMDGILNLAYICGTGLVCFDGNHRRLAIRDLDIMILLDILWDVSDDTVMHEFRRINKSVSVPDLYMENDTSFRADIEHHVSLFRKKYSSHESASERPQRPNFNRDGLIDQITRIHRETGLTIPELFTRLYNLNTKYSTHTRSTLSPKIVDKCEKSGLWLFAWNSMLSAKEISSD